MVVQNLDAMIRSARKIKKRPLSVQLDAVEMRKPAGYDGVMKERTIKWTSPSALIDHVGDTTEDNGNVIKYN
jgi:hypothetical protein